MNRPATLEGWQVWALAREAQGQIRLGPGGEALGFDAAGMIARGRALAVPDAAVAIFLPVLDAALRQADRAMRKAAEAAAHDQEPQP